MYTRGASSASRVAAAGEIRARTAASCRSSITRKSRGDRPPKFMQAIASISFRPRVTRGRGIASAPRGSVGARVLEHERGNAALRGAVAAGAPVVIAAMSQLMTGKGLFSISRASQSTKRTRSPYKGTARWRLLRESAPCDAAPARRLRGLPRRLKGARERPPGPIDRSIRKRG